MKNPFLPNMKALSCQRKEFSSKQKSETLNRHEWNTFKPHPQNLVFLHGYKIAEIFFFLSQVASDLTKSVSSMYSFHILKRP